MESWLIRTQRDNKLAFKLSVVDQWIGGELSHKQAQQRYGIQDGSTVLVRLRMHGRQAWSNAESCVAKLRDKFPYRFTRTRDQGAAIGTERGQGEGAVV